MFQSTRPCGARPRRLIYLLWQLLFQSTRPCGARLPVRRFHSCWQYVSIHAPMRGATEVNCRLRLEYRVSIHAPMRGATQRNYWQQFKAFRFNPRAHAGRDLNLPVLPAFLRCFNPRAHAGRDGISGKPHPILLTFQSTRPCGARPKYSPSMIFCWSFNPRAHAGRDWARWLALHL